MEHIAYILKSSSVLYSIYFYVVSFLLKFLGQFIKTDDHLILFNSYGGKKYDDSPKAIYDAMRQDPRFKDFRLIWALQSPSIVSHEHIETVQSDTFKYFVTALKAGVWITNSSMERGLDFKKKETVCFNTWHGTPIKVMGIDIKSDNKSFKSKVLVRADIMLAQSHYDIDIFSHAFQLGKDKFRMIGLPRNDELANYTPQDKCEIKKQLGIPEDKIVLLYAPTFREYTKGSSNEVILDVPMNLHYWQQVLGEKYVVLFRAHYEVAKHMKLDGYPMFMDMSAYPNLNELMIVSDALISDYSSIFFDFSVTGKPMYCFAYDYEQYMANRGMYIDLKDELPCTIHYDEKSLIGEVLRINEQMDKKTAETALFRQKYIMEYGHAATKSCEIIFDLLNK